MNPFTTAAILFSVGLAACAGPGPQGVSFTDGSRQDVDTLLEHVRQRAAEVLAPEQRLIVDITDLDRAGNREPWRPGLSNPRVVRDVYPARIEFEFRLVGADGTLLRQGTRTLSGLPVATAERSRDDPLRYERALLDEWLERHRSSGL